MALEAVETRRFHVRITRRWITRSNLALSMYYIHFYIPDKFASLEMFDLGSKLDNFTDSFVAKHSSGRQQVSKHDIGVANTACLDLDENLVFIQCRSFVYDLFNLVVGFTANICTRFSVRVQCIIIKASSLTQWWRKLRECSPCECILCSCFWKIEKDKYVDENVRGKGKKAKTRGIYIRKLSRSVALVSMICNGTANLVVSQKLAARSDNSFPYLKICKRFIPFGVTVHISLALFLFFLLLPSLLALEYIQQGIALRWLLWFLSLPQQLD